MPLTVGSGPHCRAVAGSATLVRRGPAVAGGYGGRVEAERGPVDWQLAARLAVHLVPPGPRVTPAEAADAAQGLRDAASAARDHVSRATHLAPAGGVEPARVRVVDRPGWARANVALLRSMTAGTGGERPSAAARTSAAVQLGGALALVGGRVLGQFDPFAGGGLLLVAPSVVGLERALGEEPRHVRLWVALHEQTHALQFAAAPWLAAHLRAQLQPLLAESPEQAASGPAAVAQLVRGVARLLTDPAARVTDLLPADQRAVVARIGAVMTLLEGHADVAMDTAGRQAAPEVRRIRARVDARRGPGRMPAGLHRLLGLADKTAQYRDGASFVRAVQRQVGVEGLNVVWTAPDLLPTPAEITDPGAWVRRVHG